MMMNDIPRLNEIFLMSYQSQKPLNIVAVSGGLNNPSKTESLVQAIIDELGD